jgi:DNA-binding protein H-NS
MNLSHWLEAQSESITPANNIRSRLARSAESAKRVVAKQRELAKRVVAKQQVCEADKERAAQSVFRQPVQAVDCRRI